MVEILEVEGALSVWVFPVCSVFVLSCRTGGLDCSLVEDAVEFLLDELGPKTSPQFSFDFIACWLACFLNLGLGSEKFSS